MIVARIAKGDLQVVDRIKEMVQMAAGLDEEKRLSKEAQVRALDCLARFGQRLRHLPDTRVRVVGTNTMRQLRGGTKFIAKAEKLLGHPIEIVSGIEEARLIYLGVAHATGVDGEGKRLVIDIGGGSTELIIGERFEPLELQSLFMGCVSITRAHLRDGLIREVDLRAAEMRVKMEMEPVVQTYQETGWGHVVGASGSIKAVRDVVIREGWSHDGITLDSLRRLRSTLPELGKASVVAQRWELSEQRAAVFSGGAIVLHGVCEALGIEHLQVSDGAMREGVIYDMLGRFRDEDVRDRTIAVMSRRYDVDTTQAENVANMATALLEPVAADWGLDDTELAHHLEWAARLHEIGLAIAHSQYHKHGAYILENSEMAGFSHSEQSLLAVLVRGHRRKFPRSELKQLPRQLAEVAWRLCVLLRIAVLRYRSRARVALPAIGIKASGKKIELSFPAGWLESSPLTRGDLEEEAEYLRAAGIKLSFR